VRAGAQEHVRVHPLLGEDLRQLRVVPERVEVRAGRRLHAEDVAQVALAVEAVAHVRLAGGHVAVRLEPPAADHLPAAVGDPLADALEERRIGLAHPFEEDNRVAGEDEVGVLLHTVDRGLEGGAHLLVALGPLPQPHRIDVRVADHVQAPFGHVLGPHVPGTWPKGT
jgi:hypothetical protein